MLAIVYHICNNLNDMRLRFAGVYDINKDMEICKMESEIYNISIPTAKDDRANLKRDMANVAKDFNKGFNIKKSEFISK